jgi:hypothetical protein
MPEARDRLPGTITEEQVVEQKQKAGKVIMVDSVSMAENGYIVVRLMTDTTLGPVVGTSTFLSVGDQKNIPVTLDKSYPPATRFAAYIHKDNGDKKFSLTNDIPVLDEQKKPIKIEFAFTQ